MPRFQPRTRCDCDVVEGYTSAVVEPESATLSICIAARNEEHTIRSWIDSALQAASTRLRFHAGYVDNYEIVVLSNGSTDKTEQAAYSIGSRRVRVISIPEGGKPNAWSRLVSLASGEFLAFMDADVTLHPESITRLISELRERPELVAAGALPVAINDHSHRLTSLLVPTAPMTTCSPFRLRARQIS